MNYKNKYLKYKFKYYNLMNQYGGYTEEDFKEILENPDENGNLKYKGDLLEDPVNKEFIHKDNAIYIDTQIYDANSLAESIIYYYNKNELTSIPHNRQPFTKEIYESIAIHLSGDDKLINKKREIINEIQNLIQLKTDIQKNILDLKPEQRKIFLSDEKFKIFKTFNNNTKEKLIESNRSLLNDIKIFEKHLYNNYIINEPKTFILIPKKYMTDEIIKLAVQNNGEALRYVPEKYMTYEIIELAVQNNGEALKHVPEKYMTDEIIKLAVQNNGLALEYVPEKYMTEEIIKLAVQNNEEAFMFVPSTLW